MMISAKQHGDLERSINLSGRDARVQRILNLNIAPLAKKIDVAYQIQHRRGNWSLSARTVEWLIIYLCG